MQSTDMKELNVDRIRLHNLVKDTVTVLCRNLLPSNIGFGLDGLICVTPDDAPAILLKFGKTVRARAHAGGDGDPEGDEDHGDDDGGYVDYSNVKQERPESPDIDNVEADPPVDDTSHTTHDVSNDLSLTTNHVTDVSDSGSRRQVRANNESSIAIYYVGYVGII